MNTPRFSQKHYYAYEELQKFNDFTSSSLIKGQLRSLTFTLRTGETPICHRALYNCFDPIIHKS